MVTKLESYEENELKSFILAKNHMVTKRFSTCLSFQSSFILAKNHMVTKPQIHVTIYLKIIKY